MKIFVNVANPTGAEPVPDAALMNDTQNMTSMFEPGKTYMFRIINIGAFAGQYLWFEGHNMSIVEVDGIYTEPAEAEMIYLTAAQRYSVLITAKNDTSTNYAFVASMDTVNFVSEMVFSTISDGSHRISSTPFQTRSNITQPATYYTTTTPPTSQHQHSSTNSTPSTTSPSFQPTTNPSYPPPRPSSRSQS